MLFLTGWLDGLNLTQTLPKASIRKKEYKPKLKHVKLIVNMLFMSYIK